MQHDGLVRRAVIRLPAGADGLQPLLLVLHGRGGSAGSIERLTRFARPADSAGFIVAYPEGVNRRWNDGRIRNGPDDVGFLAKLVGRLIADYRVDPNRVYATGMSNGAVMCYWLACTATSLLAAVAPVAGAMPRSAFEHCRPQPAVPLLAINGTADPLVGYDGGRTLAPVRKTVEFWARVNGCLPKSETTAVLDQETSDSTSVVIERWTGDSPAAEVMLYTIQGGGHTWPGGRSRPRRFGRTNLDLDATRTILAFCSRHRRLRADSSLESK